VGAVIRAFLHQLEFPPAMHQGFFFPTFTPTHVVGYVFDYGYSNRGEVESVRFRFAFPLWLEMVNFFHVFFDHLNFFF
jgi:hypothetical protein